ncbi:Srb2p NDAI_0C02120 [Naumovozyma dairenensis CBS 421]|uniref:Mediator of RNA polymerase II transcription subunit 20 n=1 Tax=Naumovozyma dairenensis (strain ATCC 10597 / BCRC 20456 / CBS 421 / NBRC 0211 / NRRL Y-12639) TaxID=1071378 RepID=G0W7W1_NAUDC|nr:hypothetical protein NDAI_0C02120 [Naumovozyma dairenensis CBS 421]CCD23872.1 hypothetical protein NDAI_0C02120 [Naumovozyma dairenensis CBS 421]
MERATPATLTEFKDELSNTLLNILDTWSIDFKTYRSTTSGTSTAIQESNSNSKLMYSITLSHQNNKTVLIKNDTKIAMIMAASKNEIPTELISNGCISDTNPIPIDVLLNNKLSNLWTQRQSIKGTGGETFQTTNKLLIRVINLFSSTGFKGLLIECEDQSTDGITNGSQVFHTNNKITFQEKIQTITNILTKLSTPTSVKAPTTTTTTDYKISMDSLNLDHSDYLGDLGYQYVRVLEF